jgi:hypothetical protein
MSNLLYFLTGRNYIETLANGKQACMTGPPLHLMFGAAAQRGRADYG